MVADFQQAGAGPEILPKSSLSGSDTDAECYRAGTPYERIKGPYAGCILHVKAALPLDLADIILYIHSTLEEEKDSERPVPQGEYAAPKCLDEPYEINQKRFRNHQVSEPFIYILLLKIGFRFINVFSSAPAASVPF